MRRIVVERHPSWYVASLMVAAWSHLILCYPAATFRNRVLTEPFWHCIAIYLGFLAVCIPPAFDELQNKPKLRNGLLAAYAVWSSAILALVATNLRSPQPHIGHLSGIIGLLVGFPVEVMIHLFGYLILALPFVFCWESLARRMWDLVRRFAESTS